MQECRLWVIAVVSPLDITVLNGKWLRHGSLLTVYVLWGKNSWHFISRYYTILWRVELLDGRTLISPLLPKTSALLGDDLSAYELELSIIWSFPPFFFFYCIIFLMLNESKCPCCACKISSCGLMVIIALPHRVWKNKTKQLAIFFLHFLLFSMLYALWCFLSKFWCYVYYLVAL